MKLKHYLIASETNNYKPWITSSMALFFFTVLVWGLRLLVPTALTIAQGYLDPADIANRINNERHQRNITTLATDSRLVAAASGKADDMLARGYFSHIDQDGNYVWPRIEAAGYRPYSTLGENLAMDFTSPDDLIAAWMNSPTHRANLLNPNFDNQGVALASGTYEPGHDTTIVVSLFGALSSKTAAGATAQTNTSPNNGSLAIGSNAQVSVTQVSGNNIVDINVEISGKPTLATAKLLTQSITLLPQNDGHFAGRFTFNLSDNLSGREITIEARNAAGDKASSSVTLGEVASIPANSDANPNPSPAPKIPISTQAEVFAILRVIFAALSIVYLSFLVTDWVIVRRAHVQRPGMLLSPQIVIFLIVAAVNIFGKF